MIIHRGYLWLASEGIRVNNIMYVSLKANQLADFLCRGATVSSIQSANNTLTRGQSLRDAASEYDVPHPHPHTHHYMTTSCGAPSSMMSLHSISRPGSAANSQHGSGSGSSPGGVGTTNYLDCLHYERMPLAIPMPIVAPSSQQILSQQMQQIHLPHQQQPHQYQHYQQQQTQVHHHYHPSEEEIEPAYATGIDLGST